LVSVSVSELLSASASVSELLSASASASASVSVLLSVLLSVSVSVSALSPRVEQNRRLQIKMPLRRVALRED